MKNLIKEIPELLIAAEVSKDMLSMFDDVARMRKNGEESPYAKMTNKEFIADRRTRTYANVDGWDNDYRSSYVNVIMARILNKTGYRTTAGDISMLANGETKKHVDASIRHAVTLFLDVAEASDKN